MSDFAFLTEYLRDPDGATQRVEEQRQQQMQQEAQQEAQALAETKQMWNAVVISDLSEEDQAKRARIAPIVQMYLSGQIPRVEYERMLAG